MVKRPTTLLQHIAKSFLSALLLINISAVLAADTSTETSTSPAEPAAEERALYQVEFIVVRPLDRSDLESEDWSGPRPNLVGDKVLKGNPNPDQPLEHLEGFSWTNSAEFDLPSTLKRLQNSGQYEVLMHRSWRQHSTPRDNATPYYVSLSFDENNRIQAQVSNYNAAPNRASDNGFKTATIGNAGFTGRDLNPGAEQAGLIGTVSFSQARYLHFTIDLLMSEHQSQAEQQANAAAISNSEMAAEELGLVAERRLRHYHLQETRRIKTKETQYFDHPAFAVLAHMKRLTD